MEKMFNFISIMDSEAFDTMMNAYIKYLYNALDTQGGKDEEIAAMPKDMLVALMCDEIDRIQNRLPVRVQENSEVHDCMRCLEHYSAKGTPLIGNKCPSVAELFALKSIISLRLCALENTNSNEFYKTAIKGAKYLPGDIKENIKKIIESIVETLGWEVCLMRKILDVLPDFESLSISGVVFRF